MTKEKLIEQLYDISLREYERRMFGEPPKQQGEVDQSPVGQVYKIARELKLRVTAKKGKMKCLK